MPKVRIAPSILSSDFAHLADEIAAVEQAGADLVHVDVMDGHFVPNLTIGPPIVEALRKVTALPLDVHLMMTNPDAFIREFAEAGATYLTVHVEACPHLHRTVQSIKEKGVQAGVTLNPATPLTSVEEILPDVDLLLIMSVNPGFGGQRFIVRVLDKIKQARAMIDRTGRSVLLEVAQVSAALGRLQLKGLVTVLSETTRPIVSLTETGKHYFQRYAPMIRVMSALRAAAEKGGQLTIKDIQTREGLDSGEISTSVGELKREGVLAIGVGGVVQTTSAASVTADSLQQLIRFVHEGPKPLSEFPASDQALIEKFSQKRGKPKEPFRVDERVIRTYGLQELGHAVALKIQKEGVREEATRLTPEMLKDGSWRQVRFRKYTIALKPARIAAGKKHPYREFLDLVKAKLVSMGFEEMRGGLIENEF